MCGNNVYNDDNNKEIRLGLPNNYKYLEIRRVLTFFVNGIINNGRGMTYSCQN